MQKGDKVYWVNDGDVILGDVVDFNDFNVKIRTPEGHHFGKLPCKSGGYDSTYGEIWHNQLATTKEEAIALVKKGISLTRATYNAWQSSLAELTTSVNRVEDN